MEYGINLIKEIMFPQFLVPVNEGKVFQGFFKRSKNSFFNNWRQASSDSTYIVHNGFYRLLVFEYLKNKN